MASKCPPLQVAVVLEGRRAALRGQLARKGLPGLFWGLRCCDCCPWTWSEVQPALCLSLRKVGGERRCRRADLPRSACVLQRFFIPIRLAALPEAFWWPVTCARLS